ncbi:hypothetical protein HID58_069187 [Brassica napus]|uniref:LOB domain-containing protein n=1 Tax=Brassica napus TaxID=3708 RepID=A0ABQ7XHJ7_BRANA|nr:hypothetical protein HID58_069187 [Brassica napus]
MRFGSLLPSNGASQVHYRPPCVGASNIIKLLQELPESQRTDAVNSMVYEAGARIRDPIYGCAGPDEESNDFGLPEDIKYTNTIPSTLWCDPLWI